jgi:hypothetical protein
MEQCATDLLAIFHDNPSVAASPTNDGQRANAIVLVEHILHFFPFLLLTQE